jgi:type VI secretion system secreted protein VgrG
MPDVIAKYAINKDIKRALTAGETHLAGRVFGGALNTSRVRIHNRCYVPWQRKGIAMTPNGHVYFHESDYKPDFSMRVADAAWLIHELTHAWQYQHGRSLILRGLAEQTAEYLGYSPYKYGKVDPARVFASYKNEQQAAMVEDFFRLRSGMPLRFGSGRLEDYERAIPFVPKTIAPQRGLRA